ncbi:hypothetical protein mRhiFer1_009149 [Rhinolophus ferrumequinum]|uniref:Mos1 transposase HTH domain-containing protein n=1 Tax=Rhinolophus ferrumequinum TaxID=59479 RepID=A0A7J7SIY0_RHIFE|nr:hypothetical protein mRhiFer1_009149 [Rhinolophus ferrumequinum]
MSGLELEQRTNIKLLVKLGKSRSEIRDMLVQVYGDNAMKKAAVYKWIKCFSEGREHVTDEECLWQPVMSKTDKNIARIRQIVRQNRQLTVRSIADQVNIDRETVKKILTENLGMRKVCAQMVPKELTDEQKQRRVEVCQDLLERQDDVLGRVITGDETWVYQYDTETKYQSAQWKSASSPQTKNFHQSKSRVKTMLLTFFDIRGIIHYEFVPTGQTVNQVYYLEVLKRLREKVRQNRPELFANNSWLLHHDNAPAHTALSVREFLASKQITVLEHPPYSPDLAPIDFFLYPKIKEILKGKHFDDIQDIKGNTMTALMAIPEKEFQNCFEGWTRRWRQCIASQGDYFEGDHSDTQ